MRIKFLFLGLSILIAATTIQTEQHRKPARVNIIFDLGGVLLRTNKMVTAQKAGILSLPFYAIFHFKNPRKALFELLNSIEPYTTTTIKPRDEHDNELPDIMCDWLKGIPSHSILKKIRPYAHKVKPLWKLAKAIFDPYTMASSHALIASAQEFVEKCIKQGHSVYILSNWDAESFEYIQRRHKKFFAQFSGIVLSGECGLLKPDPAIYNYMLDTYNLDPATCFFIDNQHENITGAQNVGINSALVTTTWASKPDFTKVEQQLNAWLDNCSCKGKKHSTKPKHS